MKALDLLNKYQKPILWLTVAILLYLLFANPCNRGQSAELKSLSAKTDSLERELKLRDERYATIQKDYAKDTAAARQQAQDAVNDVKAARKELQASKQTIYRLTARLEQSKTDTSDIVSVSSNYIEDCDSLALVAVNQQTQIDGFTEEAAEAEKLLRYETELRDEQINREKKYSDSLRADLALQTAIAKRAIEIGNPRGKLLAGAGVLGNQVNPLSGTKIALAYQSKGGKQYQAGAVLLGGTVYWEGSVLIQMFK
jgi:hypothetical protein